MSCNLSWWSLVDTESGLVTNDSLPCPDLDWRYAQLFNKPWVVQLKPLNSEMQTRVHALHVKQGTLPRDSFRKHPRPRIHILPSGRWSTDRNSPDF